jgi:hypothetical protein
MRISTFAFGSLLTACAFGAQAQDASTGAGGGSTTDARSLLRGDLCRNSSDPFACDVVRGQLGEALSNGADITITRRAPAGSGDAAAGAKAP